MSDAARQLILGMPFIQNCISDSVNARHSDPDTSHAAAASITKEAITEAQIGILTLLCEFGPATDEELARHWWQNRPQFISPSGLRTRRHELHLKGYVRADGKATVRSGNFGTMWAITEDGVQYLEGLATK